MKLTHPKYTEETLKYIVPLRGMIIFNETLAKEMIWNGEKWQEFEEKVMEIEDMNGIDAIFIERLSQEAIDKLTPEKDDHYYNIDLEEFVYFDGKEWKRTDDNIEYWNKTWKRIVDDRLKAEAV